MGTDYLLLLCRVCEGEVRSPGNTNRGDKRLREVLVKRNKKIFQPILTIWNWIGTTLKFKIWTAGQRT